MVTLLLVTAGIAAFEVAAVKYGTDSRSFDAGRSL